MNYESKINKLIVKSAYVVIIVLIIAVIALLILKYNVEGEKNMPFKLSSIIVISNAEGYQEKENKEYMWNTEIYQINDLYLNIEKNKNYKQIEAIKSIKIENIKINKEPKVGKINLYRPYGKTYQYKEEYEIKDVVEYIGDTKSDIENLKISNQGNTIMFRVINKTGKEYKSNDKEFIHNGTLLNKVNINYEDIKSVISFDLVINTESNIAFRSNIEIELPVGNIIQEGSSNIEITDTSKYIFKREQT